jgi:hypothetical protein
MNRKKRRSLASKRLWSERAAIRATFQAMVEEGLLIPTGEMRPSPIPGGPPQPVYVTREQAKVLGLVKDELQ